MNLSIFDEFPPQHELDAARGTEEIFEWIALLEAVADAKSKFTMLELGAGYGRWTVRAALALRDKHPDVATHFVAAEAEPSHFAAMKDHLDKHQVTGTLINAPVTGKRESVHFTIGHADEWYGQFVAPSEQCNFGDWPNASIIKMESTTIPDLIGGLDYIDLIDMDIQGSELPCIKSSITQISEKTRRLFIATHSDEIDRKIAGILTAEGGWHCHARYPVLKSARTQFGEIAFGDGVHYWENKRFMPNQISNIPPRLLDPIRRLARLVPLHFRQLRQSR